MDYKAPAMQMNFLRLLTKQVSQNITYSCYQANETDCKIQLQGENEMELRSSETTVPKFINYSSQARIIFVIISWTQFGSKLHIGRTTRVKPHRVRWPNAGCIVYYVV